MVQPLVLEIRRSARLRKMPPPVVIATEPEARQHSTKIPPHEIEATKPASQQHSSKISLSEIEATKPELRRSSKISPPAIETTKPESRKHSNKYANLVSHLKNPRLKTTKCSSSKLRKRTKSSKAGKLTNPWNKGTLCNPNRIEKTECVQRGTEYSEVVQISEVFLAESLTKPQSRKNGCNAIKDAQASAAKKAKYSNPTPAIVNRPKRLRKARRNMCCCQTITHKVFGTSPAPLIHDKPMRRKVHYLRDGAMKLATNFTSKKVGEDMLAQKTIKQLDCSIGETTKRGIHQKGVGLQVIDQGHDEATSKPEMSVGTQVVRAHTAVRNGTREFKSNTSSASEEDSPERKKTSRTPTSRHNKYQRFTCMETGVSMQVNCHAILQEFRRSKTKKYRKYRRSSKGIMDTATSKLANSSSKLINAQSPKSIHLNVPSQSTGIAKSTNDNYESAKTEELPTHTSYRTSSRTLPFFEQYTELQHSRDLDDQLTCHLCGLLFTGRCAIERHMVIHCNGKTPICFCALCNKTFVEFEHLEAHVLTCRRYKRLGMEEESRRGPVMDEIMNMMNKGCDFTDCNVDLRNDGISTSDNRLSLEEEYPMEAVDNRDDVLTEIVLLTGNDESLHNIDYDEKMDPLPDTSFDSAYVCEMCGLKFTGIFSLTDHYWVHEPKMVPFEDVGTMSPGLVRKMEDTIWENFHWDADRSLVYRKDGQSISNQHGEDFAASSANKDTSVDFLPVAESDENIQSYPNTNCDKSECEQTVLLDLSNCVRPSDDNEHTVQTPSAHAYPRVFPSTGNEELNIDISNMGRIANSQMNNDVEQVLFDVSNSSRHSCDPLPSTFGNLHSTATQSSSSVEGDAETTHSPAKGRSAEMADCLYECHHCQEKFQSESTLQNHVQLMGHLGAVQYVTVCSLEELQGFEHYEALQLNVGAVEVCLEDEADKTYFIQENSDNSLSLVQENILTNYRDVDILCQQCGQSFRNNMVLCHAPCFSTSEEEQKYALQELFESEIQTPSPADKCGLYHCAKCLTTFPTIKALAKHNKSHIIGKECHICGKLVRMDFMDHVKSHNVELQQKSSVCEICEELFPSIQTLAFHQSTKHNFITESAVGLTYRCPHCKEELNNTPSFIAHVAAHTGVYPFECSICKRGFLYKAALNFHLIHYHSQNQGHHPSADGTDMPQIQNQPSAHYQPSALNRPSAHYQPSAHNKPSAHNRPSEHRQESTTGWNWSNHDEGKTRESSREYEHVPVMHTSQSGSMCEERLVNQEGSKSMPSDLLHNAIFEQYGEYTSGEGDQELNRRYPCRALGQQEGKYPCTQNQRIEFGANLPQPNDAMGMELIRSVYTQQMRAEGERFPGYNQQAAVAEDHSGYVDRPASTNCFQTLCQKDMGREDLSAIGQEVVGGHNNLVQKEPNLQLNRGATRVEHFNGREKMSLDGQGHEYRFDDKFKCARREKRPSTWDCVADQDELASSRLPHFGEAFSKLRIANGNL